METPINRYDSTPTYIYKAALLFRVNGDSEVWGNATFGGTLRLFYKLAEDKETDDEFEPEMFADQIIKKYKLPNCSFSEIGRQDDGLIDLDIEETDDLTVMSKLINSLKMFPKVIITSDNNKFWKIR